MNPSMCLERAMNLSVPHWGPLPNFTEGGTFGREGSGSWEAETPPPDGPNAPVSAYMTRPAEPKGFQFNNITYREVCGSSTLAVPDENATGTPAVSTSVVINITAITNANPKHSIVIQMESCDGAVSLKASAPGVFVVPGAAAAVFVERWYPLGGNPIDGCPGQSFIAFTSATLEDYCKVDATLAECKTAAPSTSSSSPLSAIKRSLTVAAFGFLATVAATLV